MKPYICELKLCDYLTFSSTTDYANVGGVTYMVYKPQQYIHNYALMYGFSGLLHASLASIAKRVLEIDYNLLDEIEEKVYVYPARPISVSIKRMLLNIRGEGAVDVVQPKPKSVYPWHVCHMCFPPGSLFETVLLVKDENYRIPATIRVGVKRQGVFRVKCREVEERSRTRGFTDPVNLGDLLKYGLKPSYYKLLLETKTVRKDVPYSNTIVKAYFDREVIDVLKVGEKTFRVPLLASINY